MVERVPLLKATTVENHISSIKNVLAKAYNVIHNRGIKITSLCSNK